MKYDPYEEDSHEYEDSRWFTDTFPALFEDRPFEGEPIVLSDEDYNNLARQSRGYELGDRYESKVDFIDPYEDKGPTVMEPFSDGYSGFL